MDTLRGKTWSALAAASGLTEWSDQQRPAECPDSAADTSVGVVSTVAPRLGHDPQPKTTQDRTQHAVSQSTSPPEPGITTVLVYWLAHELNQPLAAVHNYASGCLRRLDSGDSAPAELFTALKQIAAEADRAASIIRHFQDHLRTGALSCAPVDINQVVRRAVAFSTSKAHDAETELCLALATTLPPVFADGVQLEEVVTNLLSNALQAIEVVSPMQRKVTVQTRLEQQKNVEVEIADSGPGLGGRDVDDLSIPFCSTRPGGMGLGLFISRYIVEAHGGRLWASPGPVGGATFRFSLPIPDGGTQP